MHVCDQLAITVRFVVPSQNVFIRTAERSGDCGGGGGLPRDHLKSINRIIKNEISLVDPYTCSARFTSIFSLVLSRHAAASAAAAATLAFQNPTISHPPEHEGLAKKRTIELHFLFCKMSAHIIIIIIYAIYILYIFDKGNEEKDVGEGAGEVGHKKETSGTMYNLKLEFSLFLSPYLRSASRIGGAGRRGGQLGIARRGRAGGRNE